MNDIKESPQYLAGWKGARFVDYSAGHEACWPWGGSRDKDGYGQARCRGLATRKAHVVVWVLAGYSVPLGSILCHTCDNPPCCNPQHMFLGTHQTNADDKVAKGRWRCKQKLSHSSVSGRGLYTAEPWPGIRYIAAARSEPRNGKAAR